MSSVPRLETGPNAEIGAVADTVPQPVARTLPFTPATAAAGALFLSACGGGASGEGTPSAAPVATTPTPTPSATAPATTQPSAPVVVVTPPPTAVQASRFLAQATMGATQEQIERVVSLGYSKWLDEQFAMPRAISHYDWLVSRGYDVEANAWTEAGFDNTVWRQLISEPDQLRQRMGVALLDILVLGIGPTNCSFKAFADGTYIDILLDNAFGNFRDILQKITYNAAMGSFLTFLNSRKAAPNGGGQPDENYARELIQLFTIGLYQLNMDGSLKMANGAPIETYTNADVSGLARVFTGFMTSTAYILSTPRFSSPMKIHPPYHETGPSSFLGTTVSGDGDAAVKTALDTIFAHPNVPPFVCKQLIQRLVSSNPSPGYVLRVATVFANNSEGVRGDLKAVLRAILTDSEARSDTALTSVSGGRLRTPVERLTAWARAFGVTSPSGKWGIGETSDVATKLGQGIGRSPTVFNFFQPGYTPAGSQIAKAGLVAPEFQLTNEQSVVGYVNYMYRLVAEGADDTKANYTAILALAADSTALVNQVNLLLAAGQLSATTLQTIRGAVDSVSTSASDGPINRVGIAIVLTLASPEFMVIR
ncbi:DUF1800 domain-containing protein [Sphingomonas sp. LB3N6]|uniref:DUF1800 domain-containing protein n=1 Tax=Sphingomonas fucosidasi TaxID=3096164 RepID=UPI002FC811C0